LSKGLKYGILPRKLNITNIQTEFEDLYQQIRPAIDNKTRIELKSKLMRLYNKYKSSFFYNKSHQDMGLSPDEQNVLDNLSKDQSILICKPDKRDGVVIMDKVDYY